MDSPSQLAASPASSAVSAVSHSPLPPPVQRVVPSGVPIWQADEESSECFLCHTPFTVFYRRHHCRKCGRVVCGKCSSSRSTYLPATYVVSPPSQIFLESPHVPHRTCDECMTEMEQIQEVLRIARDMALAEDGPSGSRSSRMRSRARHRHGSPGASSSRTVVGPGSPKLDQTLIQTISLDYANPNYEDERNLCPVCGYNISALEEEDREQHISDCLHRAEFSGFPEQHRRSNRMLIYQLNEKADASGECVICFEDFVPGDTVGRLECLCIYHEKCILDWFRRKGPGSCPVHEVHT